MSCNKKQSIIFSPTPILLWPLYLLSVITSHIVVSLQNSECGNMGNPSNELKSMIVVFITMFCFCCLHLPLSHPPFPHRDPDTQNTCHTYSFLTFLNVSFIWIMFTLCYISYHSNTSGAWHGLASRG